jgi:hypothetical protein
MNRKEDFKTYYWGLHFQRKYYSGGAILDGEAIADAYVKNPLKHLTDMD